MVQMEDQTKGELFYWVVESLATEAVGGWESVDGRVRGTRAVYRWVFLLRCSCVCVCVGRSSLSIGACVTLGGVSTHKVSQLLLVC